MQALNKRFYNTFVPAIVNRVSLYEIGNISVGFVVFPKDKYINILQPSFKEDSLCQWKQINFQMANDTNWEGILTHEITDSEDEEEKNGPPEGPLPPLKSSIASKAS